MRAQVSHRGPFARTHLAAATTASTNRFVTTTNMKVGVYTVANSGAMPTAGARHVTVTATASGTADTMGTVAIVGTDLAGDALTETIIPATGSTVAGTAWFASVTSVTGAGWVIDVGAGNDTVVVGCGAECIAVEGAGTLHAVAVNTTAAGTITLSDSAGTIGIIAASVAEGTVYYDCDFAGYLQVALGAASDATVIHTPNS